MSSYHVINSQLICSDYEKEYPMLASGKGVYLYDTKGKEYIDTSGCTAAVLSIGHGVEEVAEVMGQQARTLAVYPTHLFYNETLESYLADLCDFAPEGFNKAWTICGGTEAVENAIKLAFQYHKAKGRSTRRRVVGRWGSYHGNSITTLDVGGFKVRRDYYTALMVDHLHVSACFPFRKPEELSLEEYETSLVNEFRSTVEQHPDEIICFVAEPLVGAALGAVGPTERYFERIAEICCEHDILMVADEVMTGLGRTGKPFGCEHFGVHADILACAKGISSGYLPLGAILAHDRVLEPLQASGEPFYSGQTYSCIPLAAAVGQTVLNYIKTHDLVENTRRVGDYLKEQFRTLLDLPCVGDVRGEGLFLALEFVQDKETNEPIEPQCFFARNLQSVALEKGLVTYACRGTVEGGRGDHMLFSPPMILTTEQADTITSVLRESIVETWEKIGA